MLSSHLLKPIKIFSHPCELHPNLLRFLSHLWLSPIRNRTDLSLSSLPISAITPRCLAEKPTTNSILQSVASFLKPVITALLFSCLFLSLPFGSFAASGGRMGGSSFSSSSSSSYSSSSCSRHGYSYRGTSCSSCYSYRGAFCSSCYSYRGTSCSSDGKGGFFLMLMAVLFIVLLIYKWPRNSRIHVHKIQVALFCPARSIRRDLKLIAETTDTSKQIGLKHILTETSLALLRQSDYCISAYSSVDSEPSKKDAEKSFNQHSIEERMKLDEETLVNVNNIKKQNLLNKEANDKKINGLKKYTVVTILAVVAGSCKLPVINNIADLKDSLNKLSSIRISQTLAVEVIWTPQRGNDMISELELLENYPLLKPL